jgi:hypothetical protein
MMTLNRVIKVAAVVAQVINKPHKNHYIYIKGLCNLQGPFDLG